MAIVIPKAVVTINAVDLSNHCSSATIESEYDDLDATTFADAMKVHAKGMGDGTMSFSFFQDYAAASIDATLYPISQSLTGVVITVKPQNAVVSATNPLYTMTGLLMNYSPLDAEVGELSMVDVEFTNSSQTGIVRTTA